MSILVYQNKEIEYELSEIYGKLFLNNDVALGYGVKPNTINEHNAKNGNT